MKCLVFVILIAYSCPRPQEEFEYKDEGTQPEAHGLKEPQNEVQHWMNNENQDLYFVSQIFQSSSNSTFPQDIYLNLTKSQSLTTSSQSAQPQTTAPTDVDKDFETSTNMSEEDETSSIQNTFEDQSANYSKPQNETTTTELGGQEVSKNSDTHNESSPNIVNTVVVVVNDTMKELETKISLEIDLTHSTTQEPVDMTEISYLQTQLTEFADFLNLNLSSGIHFPPINDEFEFNLKEKSSTQNFTLLETGFLDLIDPLVIIYPYNSSINNVEFLSATENNVNQSTRATTLYPSHKMTDNVTTVAITYVDQTENITEATTNCEIITKTETTTTEIPVTLNVSRSIKT